MFFSITGQQDPDKLHPDRGGREHGLRPREDRDGFGRPWRGLRGGEERRQDRTEHTGGKIKDTLHFIRGNSTLSYGKFDSWVLIRYIIDSR